MKELLNVLTQEGGKGEGKGGKGGKGQHKQGEQKVGNPEKKGGKSATPEGSKAGKKEAPIQFLFMQAIEAGDPWVQVARHSEASAAASLLGHGEARGVYMR